MRPATTEGTKGMSEPQSFPAGELLAVAERRSGNATVVALSAARSACGRCSRRRR
jgi:hypothetical protein